MSQSKTTSPKSAANETKNGARPRKRAPKIYEIFDDEYIKVIVDKKSIGAKKLLDFFNNKVKKDEESVRYLEKKGEYLDKLEEKIVFMVEKEENGGEHPLFSRASRARAIAAANARGKRRQKKTARRNHKKRRRRTKRTKRKRRRR